MLRTDFQLVELAHGNQKPTMLCGYVLDLQIVVHTSAAPTPSEWTSYLHSTKPRGRSLACSIVRTLGGGPDAAQRREAVAYWNEEAPVVPKFAVLTDIALHRPLIAALNLFQKVPLKPFPGDALQAAATYLGTKVSAIEIRAHMETMAARLGVDVTPVHEQRAGAP